MIMEEIKIPAEGRPIEAFTMTAAQRPEKALLILPGKGYTINHFLLDFIWRMAAETGFYAIKAEYRGFTYRHLGEPYEVEDAAKDVKTVFGFLDEQGYSPKDVIVCGKSLGTLALARALIDNDISINKAVLLTPVLYFSKESGVLPLWKEYKKKAAKSLLVFGDQDPYCDMASASEAFPAVPLKSYSGADHGLHIAGDYAKTIAIQIEILNNIKKFFNT